MSTVSTVHAPLGTSPCIDPVALHAAWEVSTSMTDMCRRLHLPPTGFAVTILRTALSEQNLPWRPLPSVTQG